MAVGNNAVPNPGAGGPLSGGAFDFALDRAAAQRALAASASAGGGAAPSSKVRKPYTITKQRERWTEEEHEGFLEALKLHGRAWKKIEEHIGTKSAVQIRSHAQKFFSKLQREAQKSGTVDRAGNGDGPSESESTVTVIPPARPKRKPAHPYPRKAPDPGVHPTHSGGIANGAGASMNALKGTFGGVANGGDPNVAAAAAAAFMMAMGNGNANPFGAADPAAAAAAAAAWPTTASGFPTFGAHGGNLGNGNAHGGAHGGAGGSPYANALHSQMLALAQVNPAALSLLVAQTQHQTQHQTQQQQHQTQQQQQQQQAAAAQANAARAQQQFMAALAMIGGGGGGGGAQQQPPRAPAAAPPPSTAAAQQTPRPAPDIFSAMLNAVAADNTAAGAPNAAAPSLSDTAAFANWAAAMGAATNGSAQLATNGSAEGEAGPNVGAKGNVDQMAALANVMMFFPGIPGGAGAGAGAGAAVANGSGGGQQTHSGTGTGTNQTVSENGRDDATTKENRAERKSALEKRKRGGSARDGGSRDSKGGDAAGGDAAGGREPRGKRVDSVAPAITAKANGVDEGPHKTSGSGGSGSGGGSGSSAQTGRGAVQHGFESSSHRENSPNSEKGPNSDKGSDKGDAGVEA